MLKPTKILVPTDFSEYSDKALKQALDIAKQYNAKVHLFHVIHGELQRVVVDYSIPEEVITQIEDRQIETAKAMMKKQLDKFPRAKEVSVTTGIGKGNAAEEILNEEKEKGIDLVVIASLGRTGLSKYLIGSVARNVLKGSSAPVLLTR